MRKIRLRHKLAVLLSTVLSACGQPGPLYLPGTTPSFYVPPETKNASEKTEPEAKKTKTGAEQSTTQPEPVPQEPDQKSEPLDQPPNQP